MKQKKKEITLRDYESFYSKDKQHTDNNSLPETKSTQ